MGLSQRALEELPDAWSIRMKIDLSQDGELAMYPFALRLSAIFFFI
jgi:hypothetical protein